MNTLDIILLCILVIFLIRGLFRGLIREILSLAAIILAVYLASRYQRLLVPYLASYITTELVVNGLSYALIFIATIVVFWLLAKLIRTMLDISMLGWVDRTAGGLFGILEGALIGLILLMFIQSFAPESAWLKGSYIAPRAGHLVELVGDLAPKSMRERLRLPSTQKAVDQAKKAMGLDKEKSAQ